MYTRRKSQRDKNCELNNEAGMQKYLNSQNEMHTMDSMVMKLSNLNKFCKKAIPEEYTMTQYRILHCDSYPEILKKVTCNPRDNSVKFESILPLLFYLINCNLPFEELLNRINLKEISINSSNEVFQILFQNSELLLKSIFLDHYSFTKPIPFYFPVINDYFAGDRPTYTICKELWYCLTPHNAVLSFGIGNAANSPIGKSTLLDMMFDLNFIETNSLHPGSIDLRLTKNFYPGENCERYFTDWAFFDCHSPTPMDVVQFLLKHVHIVLIHVLETDIVENNRLIDKRLKQLNLKDKHAFVIIRDASADSEDSPYLDSKLFIEKTVPTLQVNERNTYHKECIKQNLKRIGNQIIQLGNRTPKFTSDNLEEILQSYNGALCEKILSQAKLIKLIRENVADEKRKSGINFQSLSFYPTFIELMKKKYQLNDEDQHDRVENLNRECTNCFEELKSAKMCYINTIFQEILCNEDSILLLWKLARELQQLNSTEETDDIMEQANEKYSIEILWREAILCYKYTNRGYTGSSNEYFDKLSRSLCRSVQTGEPFELIDGDNLVFFSKELNSMLRHYHLSQTKFVNRYNKEHMGRVKISEAPLVLSIIGPQSSGKSTLLNYVFGCKFLTSSGRCTRGVYGSIMELSRPINDSNFLFILDTEGIDANERGNISTGSSIHFDRSLVLFTLSVSNIVIINLPGEITANMKELLKICAFSLNKLKVKRASLPKIIFVLNMNADPSLRRRQQALKILIQCLNTEIVETNGDKNVNISDLIKLTEEDLFVLPSAYDISTVDSPGYELFEKGVIKQTPTLHFVLKCSKLKESIFHKLGNSRKNDHDSFTSLSEWLDMAGRTWDTILKFQNIVKYNNLNEIRLHQKLKMIVETLMRENYYSKKHEFHNIIERSISELVNSHGISSGELEDDIKRHTEIFRMHINGIRSHCFEDFNTQVDKLEVSTLIRREFLNHMERLISTEFLNYKIMLENGTNELLMQRRRVEYLREFRQNITSNPERFFGLSTLGREKEFERLWTENFEEFDLEEEYRERNLIDFYLSFTNEWSLINQKDLIKIYSDHKYEQNIVIRAFEDRVVSGLTNVYLTERPYFCPAKNFSPLKDIQPYFDSYYLKYLSESRFYYVHSTEGQESEFIRYFPNNKAIFKESWVPDDCVPLLEFCSGYYPCHDINWGNLSPSDQVSKLVKTFLGQKCNQRGFYPVYYKPSSHINQKPSFVKDLYDDTYKYIKENPDVNVLAIKIISSALKKRIEIFNHEISHIGAELSVFAYRDIGSYIFVLAFKSYYEKKWQLYLENRKKIMNEKKKLKIYFLTKFDISSIISKNMDFDPSISIKYDQKISEKNAKALLKIMTENAQNSLQVYILEKLQGNELFLYESLRKEAESMVQMAIDEGTNCDSDLSNFVVQFYCQRNDAFKFVFRKRWTEFVNLQRKCILTEAMNNQQREIDELIKQLERLLTHLEKEDKSLLYANHIFEPTCEQNKEIDTFQRTESPYYAMTLFLSMLMDPTTSSNNIETFFCNEFECQGVRMQTINRSLFHREILSSVNISSNLFKIFKTTQMLNSEHIFNIHSYLSNFKQILEQNQVSLSLYDFDKVYQDKIEENLLSGLMGCTNRCPSCRKYCDDKLEHIGSCSTFFHQFASMGGRAWCNDRKHSALLIRCEDYQDDMVVAVPGRLVKWGEFKESSLSKWDWDKDFSTLNSDEDKLVRKSKLVRIWNLFGEKILEFHSKNSSKKITFRPYNEDELTFGNVEIEKFQLCFVIDGTGSMKKDIEKAKSSVDKLMKSYKKCNNSIEFRIVIYRDHCDRNLLEMFPHKKEFSEDGDEIIEFLENVIPEGGGDIPEASLDGLAVGLLSDWDTNGNTKRIVIHLFDAPPHGNFPSFRRHNNNSNPNHCCCCSKECKYDWESDVWAKFRSEEIEYHGINTGDTKWDQFESTMSSKLDYLCKGFTKCGKEQVDDAIIFINY